MNSVECSPGSKFALQKRDKKTFIQTVNPIRTNKNIVLLAFHRHEELDRRLMASNAAAAVLRSKMATLSHWMFEHFSACRADWWLLSKR